MNLITKKIQVGDIKINASWNREMVNDIMLMDNYYQYKLENDIETLVIEKYFKIYKFVEGHVRYKIDKKLLRKFKLLILDKSDYYETLEKIIKNSKVIKDVVEELERNLVNELSNSISKDIIKKCIELGKI